GDLVGQADSVIAADEVEAEIDRRGGSGRGQQLSFVDEEDVLVDLDRGEASAEFLRRRPVCGGPPSAEQAGAREYEGARRDRGDPRSALEGRQQRADDRRSEEHTSELQSRFDLVCRLRLDKKKAANIRH